MEYQPMKQDDFATFFRQFGSDALNDDIERAAYMFIVTQSSEKMRREGVTTEDEISRIRDAVLRKTLETIKELGGSKDI